ncbi:MAG: hypothetical protein JNL67_07500 [Planctomycetaceae bacterium]|nr:hypothetical protein [Planctomycetaceae bacterium]
MSRSLQQWLSENFERTSQRYPKFGAYRTEFVTYKAKKSRTPRFTDTSSIPISIGRILVLSASLGSVALMMFDRLI